MHHLFEKLTPRFHKHMVSTMTVNHRITDSTLHLDHLKLDNKQAHIRAQGTIDLEREYAHLTASGRLNGIAGLTTVLFASLLEFEGEGPVDQIHWKLNGLPGFRHIRKAAKKGLTAVKGSQDSHDNPLPGR